MARHETGSEPTRTELAAFMDHDARTAAFVAALRDARCRRTERFGSDLVETMDVLRPLTGPWNLEILFRLSMDGPQRFNGLRRGLPGISSRVLTDKLRHLEAHGLVERRDPAGYALVPPGEVVARHLHPLVFALRNSRALGLVAPSAPASII